LRTALVEAAWQWTQRDATAHDHYKRLLSNTGEKKKAIVGVARKLGIVLWRMLVSGKPYCPGMVNVPRSVFEGMKRQTAKQ
jgi:transposase